MCVPNWDRRIRIRIPSHRRHCHCERGTSLSFSLKGQGVGPSRYFLLLPYLSLLILILIPILVFCSGASRAGMFWPARPALCLHFDFVLWLWLCLSCVLCTSRRCGKMCDSVMRYVNILFFFFFFIFLIFCVYFGICICLYFLPLPFMINIIRIHD